MDGPGQSGNDGQNACRNDRTEGPVFSEAGNVKKTNQQRNHDMCSLGHKAEAGEEGIEADPSEVSFRPPECPYGKSDPHAEHGIHISAPKHMVLIAAVKQKEGTGEGERAHKALPLQQNDKNKKECDAGREYGWQLEREETHAKEMKGEQDRSKIERWFGIEIIDTAEMGVDCPVP